MLLIFLLFVISLVVFPPQLPGEKQTQVPSNMSDLTVNLGILDSQQMKNLELFSHSAQTEFTYTATDKKGKKVTGKISATDENAARTMLTEKGLVVTGIKGQTIGKSQPFLPYYQPTLP